jgi:hypothetical protein
MIDLLETVAWVVLLMGLGGFCTVVVGYAVLWMGKDK